MSRGRKRITIYYSAFHFRRSLVITFYRVINSSKVSSHFFVLLWTKASDKFTYPRSCWARSARGPKVTWRCTSFKTIPFPSQNNDWLTKFGTFDNFFFYFLTSMYGNVLTRNFLHWSCILQIEKVVYIMVQWGDKVAWGIWPKKKKKVITFWIGTTLQNYYFRNIGKWNIQVFVIIFFLVHDV